MAERILIVIQNCVGGIQKTDATFFSFSKNPERNFMQKSSKKSQERYVKMLKKIAEPYLKFHRDQPIYCLSSRHEFV